MGENETTDRYEPPAPLPGVELIGTCEIVVHGLDGTTPGTTIPGQLYAAPRDDGRTTIQVAPLQPQHRRRFGSFRFIVERPEIVTTKESKR